MKNEGLCKVLGHNLCCLIPARCELGIEPVFWQNGPSAPRDVIRLPARA